MLIKFSAGEGRGEDSVEGVGPGEWKDLPVVEGWEDGGCLGRLLLCLRLGSSLDDDLLLDRSVS